MAAINPFIGGPMGYYFSQSPVLPSKPTPIPKSVKPYSGSVNAFTSGHTTAQGNSFQEQDPWTKLAASADSKVSSAIPAGDAWVDPYAGMDPAKMAANEVAPQLALLAQQEGQAKTNYGNASKDISLGWDLIAKEVAAREKGIKTDTAARGAALTKGWGSVSNNSNAALDAARAEIIANAQNSGNSMESIAPLLAKLATSKATLGAETGARQQNWSDFNAQMGQNAVQENQLAQDTAKWGGINAKADFANRLQSALQDLANKRLDVAAGQAANVNKYGMQIASGRSSSRDAWNTLQTQRAQQQIDLAAANNKTPAEIDPSKLTPSEYLAYVAGHPTAAGGFTGLYTNPTAARNAAQAIQDTFIGGTPAGGFKSAADFVAKVLARSNANQRAHGQSGPATDARQLAQLAQDYYTKIAGGANNPYGGSRYP
jgi:hypothetical protein